MSGTLFIGIEGGATRCRARISDVAGNVLGEATRKASANISSRKPATVMGVILSAIRTAARRGGIAEAAWRDAPAGFGLAGADVTRFREELAGLFKADGYFSATEIRNDAYVTWLGAHGGADGAILILGTGSCGLAVVKGKEIYVSGYGPLIGDEASGQWLGRMAIRRSLWALDGRIDGSALSREILARFDNSPESIVTFAKTATASDLGEFAPLVFDHAEARDTLALAIVADAAKDAERMIARLLDAGAPSVYLHGGISERLSRWLKPGVRKTLKPAMNLEGVALDGAILLARRAAKLRGRVARK